MKKAENTARTPNEFTRFDELLRKVVTVPKEEINRREKAEKQKKEAKKKG